MIYAIIAVVLLAAFGGYTAYEQHLAAANATAKLVAAQAQADALLAAKNKAAVDAANEEITNMQAAYDAGATKAKVVTQKVYLKGQADVAKYPVFADPNCVLPDVSLQLLNSARAHLRTPTDTVVPVDAVPEPGPAAGRKTGDAVPAIPSGRDGTVVGVRAPARPTDSGGQVPGSGLPSHPKPKPIH